MTKTSTERKPVAVCSACGTLSFTYRQAGQHGLECAVTRDAVRRVLGR